MTHSVNRFIHLLCMFSFSCNCFFSLLFSLLLIRLLLRRGADPSYSDWPLPVLAWAVRAGDENMVELLLKKKAQVNCKLNDIRHASLTPLHIACGNTSSNAVNIVRQLLEHGADVNAKSLAGNKEYLSLVDLLLINSIKMVNEFVIFVSMTSLFLNLD